MFDFLSMGGFFFDVPGWALLAIVSGCFSENKKDAFLFYKKARTNKMCSIVVTKSEGHHGYYIGVCAFV